MNKALLLLLTAVLLSLLLPLMTMLLRFRPMAIIQKIPKGSRQVAAVHVMATPELSLFIQVVKSRFWIWSKPKTMMNKEPFAVSLMNPFHNNVCLIP